MSKWKHSISIKDDFLDDPWDEEIAMLALKIANKLDVIWNKEIKEKDEIVMEYVMNDLENVIDEFRNIHREIYNGESSEEYMMDSWIEYFDNVLEQLYDVGDTVVSEDQSFFNRQKFMWIG